jgi:hypothetical protein
MEKEISSEIRLNLPDLIETVIKEKQHIYDCVEFLSNYFEDSKKGIFN